MVSCSSLGRWQQGQANSLLGKMLPAPFSEDLSIPKSRDPPGVWYMLISPALGWPGDKGHWGSWTSQSSLGNKLQRSKRYCLNQVEGSWEEFPASISNFHIHTSTCTHICVHRHANSSVQKGQDKPSQHQIFHRLCIDYLSSVAWIVGDLSLKNLGWI